MGTATMAELLHDYRLATGALALELPATEQKHNAIMIKKDPEWAKKTIANQQDVHAQWSQFEEKRKMEKLTDEYNRNTQLQDAAQRMEHTANYMNNMQDVIRDSNHQKLSDINADLMTSKRLSSINTEAVVRMEDDTLYLRSFIIAMCVAILVMVLCVSKVVSLPVTNILLAVIVLSLAIALIAHAVDNSNRLSMLFPEREWPLYKDMMPVEEECACTE